MLLLDESRQSPSLEEVRHLELAFSSKKLRSVCESERLAVDELGSELAENLKKRLADLCASSSVDDIVVGGPHDVEVEGRKGMAIDLGHGYQLVFVANHPDNPTIPDGDLDWSRVDDASHFTIDFA